MNKLFVLLLILGLLSLAACSAKTQSLQMFYTDEGIRSVDTFVITDGTSGFSRTITEQEEIDEFLKLINDIEFSPLEDQSKREGWRYTITLYDGDNKFEFTLNQIGEVYYDSKPDIFPIVNGYYENLE